MTDEKDKCPFCFAAKKNVWVDGILRLYECDCWAQPGIVDEVQRTPACYERQIAALEVEKGKLFDELIAEREANEAHRNMIDDLQEQLRQAREENTRLAISLAGMIETHGMHGPCEMNSCKSCTAERRKAIDLLARRAALASPQTQEEQHEM